MRKINLSGYIFEKESGETYFVLELKQSHHHLIHNNINFSLYVRDKYTSIIPKVLSFKFLKEKLIKAKVKKKINPLNPLNRTRKEKFIDTGKQMSKLAEALDVIESLGTNETEAEFADDVGKDNPADKLNRKKRKHPIYDHTIVRPVEEWKANDFLCHMHKLFVLKYDMESFEFNQYAPGIESKSPGKLFSIVDSQLIKFFAKQKLDNSTVKEYVEWVFTVKAEQLGYPIMLSTIISKSMMTEWQYSKVGHKKNQSKRMTRFEAAKMKIKRRK